MNLNVKATVKVTIGISPEPSVMYSVFAMLLSKMIQIDDHLGQSDSSHLHCICVFSCCSASLDFVVKNQRYKT